MCWLCLTALGLLATPAPAQKTRYTNWGGLNGITGSWSRKGFYTEASQLWDRGGLDFSSTRSQTVRFGGGLHFLESIARDAEFLGVASYSVAPAPAPVRGKLSSRPALSLGVGWHY
jgi:hypothetical protein